MNISTIRTLLSIIPFMALPVSATEFSDQGAGDVSEISVGTAHAVSSARRAVRLRSDSKHVAIIDQGRTLTPASKRPARKVYNVTDIRRSRVIILNTGQSDQGGGG